MAQFAFSTGKLSIAPVGTAFDASHVVGAVQSADFDTKLEIKEVREAASISLYPVDHVMYDAMTTLKIECVDLMEKLIEYCTGAVKTSSGGANVYTASTTSLPQFVKIKLEGKLTDGRAATIEITRGRAPGLPLGFKRDDYVKPSVEFRAYPLLTTDAAWVITIAQ